MYDTLSVSQFAELTGLSRERLRTWERRHGFPQPVRHRGGPRRYERRDIAIVVKARQAVDSGVPVADAIEQATRAREDRPAGAPIPEPARAFAESIPLPLVLLSGPDPLRVEYVNAAAGAALEPGMLWTDVVEGSGGDSAQRSLQRLFARGGGPIECEDPAWTDPPTGTARSIAFRVPPELSTSPLAGLICLDADRERSQREHVAHLIGELESLRSQSERDAVALVVTEDLARRMRNDKAGDIIRAATSALVERLHAADAGVALYMAGEFVLGSSAHGSLGPKMVLASRYRELGSILGEHRSVWLRPATAVAFGANDAAGVLAVPVAVTGDILAALLLVFADRRTIEAHEQRLIEIVTSTIGVAVLRDRFADGAPATSEGAT